jgi:molybdopterin/thiamine biosynthesis adenylyltransferase
MAGKINIKLIGVGGIGCALAPFLARYLQAERQVTSEEVRITLVDGDTFESRNSTRQGFETLGNKAKVKATELARSFPDLSFRAIPEFVTAENLPRVVKPGDLVFLAVDNHATRGAVSRRCEELSDVVLISGGNDFTDGNVQVYVRQEGRDITLPLTRFHPEIADPKDKSPAEMSCEELAAVAAPQLLFMNLSVASAMLNAFYAWRSGRLLYGEVYLDIVEGRAQPVSRAPGDGQNDK